MLFSEVSSLGENEPKVYHPHPPEQDPKLSLVDDKGRYDMARFSPHEKDVVLSVLNRVDKVYPKKYLSIGLANETYCVKYKARDILFQILILRHLGSRAPLDQLAVSMAYQAKGYYYRKEAISYFELAEPSIKTAVLEKFGSYYPLSLFSAVASFYESDGQFERALSYARLASIYSTPNNQYFLDWTMKLEANAANPPEIYHRSMSEKRREREDQIVMAAQYFIGLYGH